MSVILAQRARINAIIAQQCRMSAFFAQRARMDMLFAQRIRMNALLARLREIANRGCSMVEAAFCPATQRGYCTEESTNGNERTERRHHGVLLGVQEGDPRRRSR